MQSIYSRVHAALSVPGERPRPCSAANVPRWRQGCRRPSSSIALRAEQQQQGATTSTAADPPSAGAPEGSRGGSSSSGGGGGFLQDPQQQSVAFLVLSGTSALLGIAAIAAPQQLLSAVLDGAAAGGALAPTFTRIAGGTMFISAATEYSLYDAVVAGHLKSATYHRLMVGVIAKSSLYLAAFLLSPGAWTPALAALYPTAALASVAVNVAVLREALRQSGAPPGLAGLAPLAEVGAPKTPAAWVYSAFALLYLATVAACYAPEAIFTAEPLTPAAQLLKLSWAPGFLLAAAACVVLKDAAERGRLGASTFRRLNGGLAAVEVTYTAVFAWAIWHGLAEGGASSWSNLAGSVAIAAFCAYQAVAAKKN